MSFSISKTVYPTKRYQTLGNLTIESAVGESLEVIITAEAVNSLVGNICTVAYSIKAEGSSINGYDYVEFEYKGLKGPLEEAEDYLITLLGE